LVYDELGVDHVFVDEAHYFKNLETPTKMERVAGIQTGGSERAFDLFMKARFLNERHPGHGVTFATGTPISNTMVELYNVERFLDPEGLASRGIEHFDAWAATFGEVVDTMEISPDGKTLKPRSRFARFMNLPELQQMFRSFADVQTADMLDLPCPKLSGGKARVVACPMSEAQRTIQDSLVRRYERLRSQKVDPREDNALAITTDGRKLALDGRLLSPETEDFPDSKVNAMVDTIHGIWRRTTPFRGTQLVFCDIGVNPTPWGYSVYQDVMGKLIKAGIPRAEIAAIGEADTDAKTQALFERVRNGAVRVLIGSTAKMGTGTNVQKRLIALHHLDAPWKPAEVEQREGRILRQGNENEEVSIYRYVTERSFDAYMWQALETKARFITQVMAGNSNVRRAEDIGGQELSYAEVKAIASGNLAVLTLAEAEAELQRLSVLRKNHGDEQFLARRAVRDLPETITRLERKIAGLEADSATLERDAEDFAIGERRVGKAEVFEVLSNRLKVLPERVKETSRIPLGRFRGLKFGVTLHPGGASEVFLEGNVFREALLSRENRGPRAVLNALERLSSSYGDEAVRAGRDLEIARGQLEGHGQRLGQPFRHGSYQIELSDLRDKLKAALSEAAPEKGPSASELSDAILALKAAQTVEMVIPLRSGTRRAERPVTSRIREKRGPEEREPQVEDGCETVAVSADGPSPETPPRVAAEVKEPQQVGRIAPVPLGRSSGRPRQGMLF
jgi:hypothetical protein